METMKKRIEKAFKDSAATKLRFVDLNIDKIIEVTGLIVSAFKSGNKLMLFGNGGSATDASHLAAEFVNRFKKDRDGLPAISLTSDMAVMTSISNDYDYSDSFARQIKAFGRMGDVVIAISTSGNSPNVIKAVEASRRLGIKTIAFTGGNGGRLASESDYAFIVPSDETPRIQETHITLGHVMCELIEEEIFGG